MVSVTRVVGPDYNYVYKIRSTKCEMIENSRQ